MLNVECGMLNVCHFAPFSIHNSSFLITKKNGITKRNTSPNRSVASTQKITSAMKMVSAAKLKKTEGITTRFLPYKNKLSEALANYLGSLEGEVNIPLAEHREVKRVALMAFASSSGLCGVYNSSVCKLFKQVYDEYAKSLGAENVIVFVVGKKLSDYAKKFGITVEKAYEPLAEKHVV